MYGKDLASSPSTISLVLKEIGSVALIVLVYCKIITISLYKVMYSKYNTQKYPSKISSNIREQTQQETYNFSSKVVFDAQ